jgi:hypothetical protein
MRTRIHNCSYSRAAIATLAKTTTVLALGEYLSARRKKKESNKVTSVSITGLHAIPEYG